MSVSNVFAISRNTTPGSPIDSQGDGSNFDAAMLEAILRGNPDLASSPDGHGGTKLAYHPADAAAMGDAGRNWVGATRKSDIEVDNATNSISAIAGADGKLSLDEVTAYLQKYDPTGMSGSDIANGWHRLTGGTDEPLGIGQLRGAVGNVVNSRPITIASNEDPDGLANALAAFKKEASKTVADRAKDEILKKHNLSEAAYAQLPATQKLTIDHEIADRVQLLLRTDGKKPTENESAERAAITSKAAATAASIEKQQAAYFLAQIPENGLRQMSSATSSLGATQFAQANVSRS